MYGVVEFTGITSAWPVTRQESGLASSVVRSKATLTVHSRGLGRFGPCAPNFLSRGGLHLRRSLFNKICDSSSLRYLDGVPSPHLNHRSTPPPAPATLASRWH